MVIGAGTRAAWGGPSTGAQSWGSGQSDVEGQKEVDTAEQRTLSSFSHFFREAEESQSFFCFLPSSQFDLGMVYLHCLH